jgi:hypothetical protein
MIDINKIFSEKDIIELKKERLGSIINSSSIIDFLSKYGFNDGYNLYPDESQIVEELLNNVITSIKSIGEIELHVTHTGHNPVFITFYNNKDSKSFHYDDFEPILQDGIYNILLPVFEVEINKMRKNYNIL